MDSGAEEHVVTIADWPRLGGPLLQLAQVRQMTTWKCWGPSYCAASAAKEAVEVTSLVANQATKSVSLHCDETLEC